MVGAGVDIAPDFASLDERRASRRRPHRNAAIGAEDPVKYAILDAEFDWGGHTPIPTGVSGFGGAYAFKEGGVN